jgi:hypothetical protein
MASFRLFWSFVQESRVVFVFICCFSLINIGTLEEVITLVKGKHVRVFASLDLLGLIK